MGDASDLLGSHLVTMVAPWCERMDNMELAIALFAQPWACVGGVRRAEFQEQLEQMAEDLPLGNIYFQRINRAVAELEKRGVLCGQGDDRGRRFILTPGGFAAVVLNLNVLSADPTIDGAEFEFKREFVAAWHLMADRFRDNVRDLTVPREIEDFFEQVMRLEVFGRPVVTDALLSHSFNVINLITLQREHVSHFRALADMKLSAAKQQADFLGTVDLSALASSAPPMFRDNPKIMEALRSYMTSDIPLLAIEAKLARYDFYLGYLDTLARKYGRPLNLIDFGSLTRLVKGA